MRTTNVGLGLAWRRELAPGLPTAGAVPAAPQQIAAEPVANPNHVLPNPKSEKQTALRQEAWANVLSGEATPQTINGTKVLKVGQERGASAQTNARSAQGKKRGKTQYVELENERTDKCFVFLVEFGDKRDPTIRPGHVRGDPRASALRRAVLQRDPEAGPDDNSTQWQAKYTEQYYKDLYFGEGKGVESLKTYYERQSSGRYSVEGMVTDFTVVPYNQARYGRSDGYPCAGNVCSNTWNLISDGMTTWVADQKAAGRTDAQIKRTVAQYDIRDRYDFDGDGNFDEPDGYIDRFQIIHAGGDQADGDPIYGEDAIWSHRWKAFQQGDGVQGPAGNLDGGTQIGTTGIWVADYTSARTAALGCAHESVTTRLPDHYATAAGGTTR